MIIELWIILVVLALAASTAAFISWRQPLLFFVAGLLWFIVGGNSGLIEMSVVYDASDYLREFRYPFIVLFFTLLGAAHFIIFTFKMLAFFKKEAGEAVR